MTITIDRELLLYQFPPGDYSKTLVVPRGTYRIRNAGTIDGERWWKLADKDFGNAAACWNVMRASHQKLAEFVDKFSKRGMLIIAAVIWGCFMAKTDWVTVKDPANLVQADSVASVISQHYQQGYAYTSNGSILIRYASGAQIIRESLTQHEPSPYFKQAHIVQVHKDLVLLVMLISLIWPSRKLVFNSFKFLLPFLLVPILHSPPDPTFPFLFYYLSLAGVMAALFWHNDCLNVDIVERRWTIGTDRFLGTVALLYNVLLFLKVQTFM